MNREQWGFALLTLFLWGYVILRAWYVPVTGDEASSFFDFIRPFHILPPFARWEANNHLLNSLLSALFCRLLGCDVFVLRLANILAFPVYAFFLYRLLARARSPYVRWTGYVLLLCAHGLLEFFALSRGYGLSFALLVMNADRFLAFLESHHRKALAAWSASAVLMVSANLSLLPVSLFMGGLLLFKGGYNGRRTSGWFGLWLLFMGAFTWFGFELKDRGLLYYGTEDFVGFTVKYSTAIFMGSGLVSWLPVPVVALLAAWCVRAMVREGGVRALTSRQYVFAVIFFAVLGFAVAQHLLQGMPYPKDRSAFHLLLLVFIAMLFALDEQPGKTAKAAFSLSLLLPVSLVFSANLSHTSLWKGERLPEGVVKQLEVFEERQGRPPTIGSAYWSKPVWWYLQNAAAHSYRLQGFACNRASAFDFMLVRDTVPQGFEAVTSDPDSPWELYQRTLTHEPVRWSRLEPGLPAADPWEYFSIADTVLPSSGADFHLIVLQLDIVLDPAWEEVFLVIDAGCGERRDYELIDLTHFEGLEALYGEGSFSLASAYSAGEDIHLKAYVWNKNLEAVPLRRAQALVEARVFRPKE